MGQTSGMRKRQAQNNLEGTGRVGVDAMRPRWRGMDNGLKRLGGLSASVIIRGLVMAFVHRFVVASTSVHIANFDSMTCVLQADP